MRKSFDRVVEFAAKNLKKIRTWADKKTARLTRPVGIGRAYVTDLATALRPVRFGILGVVIAALALTETATGQGRDILRIYDGITLPWEVKGWAMYIGLAVFGLLTWYETRRATRLRFGTPKPSWGPDNSDDVWSEQEYMEQYRIQFPSPGIVPESNDAKAVAESRVKWILGWRKWMPRALGACAVWSVSLGYAFINPGSRHLIPTILMGAVFLALFIFRRPMLRAYQAWRAKRDTAAGRPIEASQVTIPEAGSEEDEIREADRDDKFSWSATSIYVRCVVYPMIAGLLIIWLIFPFAPVNFGEFLGAMGVFLVIVTLVVVLGTLLARATRRSNLPIFSVVVFILFFWHWLAGEHYLRPTDVVLEAGSKDRLHIVDAVRNKIEQLRMDADGNSIPLVFVATAGGGSRAAYWTGTVLGRLEDRSAATGTSISNRFSDRLVAISGVSGGSLGAGVFVSVLGEKPKNCPPEDSKAKGCVEHLTQKIIDRDFLGPTLASMFSRDLLPIFKLHDRSAAIERSWEDAWCDAICPNCGTCVNKMAMPVTKLFENRPLPALFLNGTIAETGSRLITSNLRFGGGAHFINAGDLLDLRRDSDDERLKNDIRLSTAISTSARLPIVLPAARVQIARVSNADRVEARLVDGGYFENFGATTLIDILNTVEPDLAGTPKIIPVVIQISSDPDMDVSRDDERATSMVADDLTPLSLLAQLRSPLRGALSTRGAHGIAARLALKQKVASMGGGYFHFSMGQENGHAGDGPSLGWFLSKEATESIRGLLARSDTVDSNGRQFEDLVNCLKSADRGKCRAPQK